MKGKGKRLLSGLLSLLTILTSVIQPVITYAAEPETSGYEAQYPALETVREYLDAEEIVTATDYEVETGSSFDVKSDFSGSPATRPDSWRNFRENRRAARRR